MNYKLCVIGLGYALASGVAQGQDVAATDISGASEISNSEAAETGAGAESLQTIPVAAPENPEEAPSAGRTVSNRAVEEIIVTAQKRAENIQDVPISIAAFSADSLDARGVSEPKDLQMVVPGLTFNDQAGYSIAFIRGIGSEAFLSGDPSVAQYTDGVYFPFSRGIGTSFGAVERIEVLKGPQGTLFGRNAVGGAINIITKDPGSEPETSVQVGYERYDSISTRVYTSIPITDSLAISLAGFYNSEDRYYTNSTAGGDPLPKEVERGARLKIKWSPFENTDVVLSGYVLRQQGTGTLFQPNDHPFLLATALGVPKQEGYDDLHIDAPVYFKVEADVLAGQVISRFDSFDVKAIGSTQYTNAPTLFDADGSARPLVSFEAKKLTLDAQSGELQILSNDTSWASDRLKWIGGLYYFRSKGGLNDVDFQVASDLNVSLAGVGVPAVNVTIPAVKVNLVGLLGIESRAAYGQATYNFTDWLALTGGGRYQIETRRIIQSTVSGVIPGVPGVIPEGSTLPVLDYPNLHNETKRFSPKISLELKPDNDLLFYASWQKASKSATFNSVNITVPPNEVKAEDLKALEIGAKTTLFDGALRFNAAAFQYDDKNLQTQFISLQSGGILNLQNADARIRGLDVDMSIYVLPALIDNLTLTSSATYLNAKYTNYSDAFGFRENTGLFYSNGDFAGNRIVRTPKYSANIGLAKTFDIYRGPLEIALEGYFSGDFYFLAQNSDFSRQDAYHVLNAHISYLYEPWNLRVTAFGENLTNSEYSIGQIFIDFGRLDSLSKPRSGGLRLNWDF